MEHESRLALIPPGGEVERNRVLTGRYVTDPLELMPIVHELAAAGPGGFCDHAENHGQERSRIVRRSKGVADEGESLASISPPGGRRSPALAGMITP
jgi:hypothetical protein